MAIVGRSVGKWIAQVLGLDAALREAEAARDAARDAAARAGLAAAQADEAAAAASEWYHLGLPFRQGTGVHLTESHDILAEELPFRHDILAGRRGGPGRAWRELDNDIETLD